MSLTIRNHKETKKEFLSTKDRKTKKEVKLKELLFYTQRLVKKHPIADQEKILKNIINFVEQIQQQMNNGVESIKIEEDEFIQGNDLKKIVDDISYLCLHQSLIAKKIRSFFHGITYTSAAENFIQILEDDIKNITENSNLYKQPSLFSCMPLLDHFNKEDNLIKSSHCFNLASYPFSTNELSSEVNYIVQKPNHSRKGSNVTLENYYKLFLNEVHGLSSSRGNLSSLNSSINLSPLSSHSLTKTDSISEFEEESPIEDSSLINQSQNHDESPIDNTSLINLNKLNEEDALALFCKHRIDKLIYQFSSVNLDCPSPNAEHLIHSLNKGLNEDKGIKEEKKIQEKINYYLTNKNNNHLIYNFFPRESEIAEIFIHPATQMEVKETYIEILFFAYDIKEIFAELLSSDSIKNDIELTGLIKAFRTYFIQKMWYLNVLETDYTKSLIYLLNSCKNVDQQKDILHFFFWGHFTVHYKNELMSKKNNKNVILSKNNRNELIGIRNNKNNKIEQFIFKIGNHYKFLNGVYKDKKTGLLSYSIEVIEDFEKFEKKYKNYTFKHVNLFLTDEYSLNFNPFFSSSK